MNSRDITEYLETHQRHVVITLGEDYKTRNKVFTGVFIHPTKSLMSGDVLVKHGVEITEMILDKLIEGYEIDYQRKMLDK